MYFSLDFRIPGAENLLNYFITLKECINHISCSGLVDLTLSSRVKVPWIEPWRGHQLFITYIIITKLYDQYHAVAGSSLV